MVLKWRPCEWRGDGSLEGGLGLVSYDTEVMVSAAGGDVGQLAQPIPLYFTITWLALCSGA